MYLDFVFISVGEVLAVYDADRKFPSYGFGAKPTKDEMVNQFFPINYNAESPACDGIDGILNSYYETLKKGVCLNVNYHNKVTCFLLHAIHLQNIWIFFVNILYHNY